MFKVWVILTIIQCLNLFAETRAGVCLNFTINLLYLYIYWKTIATLGVENGCNCIYICTASLNCREYDFMFGGDNVTKSLPSEVLNSFMFLLPLNIYTLYVVPVQYIPFWISPVWWLFSQTSSAKMIDYYTWVEVRHQSWKVLKMKRWGELV